MLSAEPESFLRELLSHGFCRYSCCPSALNGQDQQWVPQLKDGSIRDSILILKIKKKKPWTLGRY